MKNNIIVMLLDLAAMFTAGCKKYLDINTNPNYPQKVAANLYLSPIQANIALGLQNDGRFLGKYVQNWVGNASNDLWDRHGHNQYAASGADFGGELWRVVYWRMGQNLSDMIALAEKEKRWDIVGAGKVLRAWGWQMLTDMHGEIIMKEAFDPNKKAFQYDSQQDIYTEVVRLCKEGIADLERTDGASSKSYFGQGDLIFKGDKDKWIKFGYGLLAINALHLSNKTDLFDADLVIQYVDKALASNLDDAIVPFAGSVTSDANYFGPRNNTVAAFRQSEYVVNLMNGGATSGVVDPRMNKMLVPAPDGKFRGLSPTFGYGTLVTAQRPFTLWRTVAVPAPGVGSWYIFNDNSGFPIMTYAQLQFIKAEAALKKQYNNIALQAYVNGISAHIDYVNEIYSKNTPVTGVTTVSAIEKNAYLSNVNIVPNASALTVQQILLQKYIAQWGWGFIETWTDIRRNHYETAKLNGFMVPTNLFPDNNGLPAYRMRPRFNSEYVWNRDALGKVGGLKTDYATYEMWFTKP